jgi:hypothetical protein
MNGRFDWMRSLIATVVSILISSCAGSTPRISTSEPTVIPSKTPLKTSLSTQVPTIVPATNESVGIAFEVTFDGTDCAVTGPVEVPIGDYLFSLKNESDQKVDIAVTHLIDGHTYRDLLDRQSEPGEPFVKVYWMSQPYYFTRDHKVWNYSLDEPGEHAVLVLKHVFEGVWICAPFDVIEATDE